MRLNVRVSVCARVCLCVWERERVNVCSRVGGWVWAFMFLNMLVGLHVQYLRMCAFLLVCCWRVGVCVQALSVCLCVCMCFAHSQPIFIHAVISTIVHVFLGGFRQGQEKHVEDLIFSGTSVCSNTRCSLLREEQVLRFFFLISCWSSSSSVL